MIFRGGSFDYAGTSVAFAGDVNGDGFADIIIGAPGTSGGTGTAYVVFGGQGVFAGRIVTLDDMDADDGLILTGAASDSDTGHAVAGAGDVNGDGYDDMLIGAPGEHGAYVVYGRDFTGDVTLEGTSSADTLAGSSFSDVIIGGLGDDTLVGGGGFDVLKGGAGDDTLVAHVDQINGNAIVADGGTGTDTLKIEGHGGEVHLDDLNPGALSNIEKIDLGGEFDLGGGYSLRLGAKTVLGLSETTNTVTVTGGSSNDAIRFTDATWELFDEVGSTHTYVSGNATVVVENADIVDVTVPIIGADGVVNLDIENDGILFLSAFDDSTNFGYAVSAAGDVNGDGFGDFVIGATSYGYFYDSEIMEGIIPRAAYVIFGDDELSSRSSIDLSGDPESDLDGANALRIEYEESGEFGYSLSAAGDVDGDGFDDFLATALAAAYDGSGAAHLVFGRSASDWSYVGSSESLQGLASIFPYEGASVLTMYSSSTPYTPELAVGSGDINGDGLDDILIGIRGSDYYGSTYVYAGETFVVFGDEDLTSDPVILDSFHSNQELGGLSAYGYGVTGSAYSIYNDYAYTGWAVGAVDFNGDGFDDLLIGAPKVTTDSIFGETTAEFASDSRGQAYVVFGDGLDGTQNVPLPPYSSDGFTLGAAEDEISGSYLGYSVNSAGDVNGDGFEDIIVGAPYANYQFIDNNEARGGAYIVFGTGSPPTGTIPEQLLAGPTGSR